MKIGTKSVLYGAHCFFLHPWFVAAAWTRLYGFPWDPRLWFAFFVHDIGYWRKPNMDGPEGELHPELGARIMGRLFDYSYELWEVEQHDGWSREDYVGMRRDTTWHDFCLCHSRYLAKKIGKSYSRLCVADKLAFAVTPKWLYLPMVKATGEIHEYLKNAKAATAESHFRAADYSKNVSRWHDELRKYMIRWVAKHKNGAEDTWTSSNRQLQAESGVWK